MHADLEALLALQAEDTVIEQLLDRGRALDAREQTARADEEALEETIDEARAALEEEEARRRDLETKVETHKQLQDRNIAQLDQVRKAKEATAAMSQIDITRKVLAQEESDLHAASARVAELRHVVIEREAELSELQESQRATLEVIAGERAALDDELGAAREKREDVAKHVSRAILAKYERIRGRDPLGALYPLRGMACGRCNTAIPLQRRNSIAAGRAIDICEGCGVLLYAAS